MRVFYFTTVDPNAQGDFQELSTLIGLRELLGSNCIDFPRKKILYGDFSDTPKDSLHGRGFTYCSKPIEDFERNASNHPDTITSDDVIIYGTTEAYNNPRYPQYESRTPYVFFIDGHDDPRIRIKPCFKREFHLADIESDVAPIGFGIPSHFIKPISFSNKIKLYQSTAPKTCFGPIPKPYELRSGINYLFQNEEDYYHDMEQSWFGLTCGKGGYDTLRHYEILAAGSLLMFRNYTQKPVLCSPQYLPCVSYSYEEELMNSMSDLLVNGKPSNLYLALLYAQRDWLLKNGTCLARASLLIKFITCYMLKKSFTY